MILSAENRDARCMVGRPDSRRAGPASERSRLATDSARSGTERRTAFPCVEDHERICADTCSLIDDSTCRSVRAFCARSSSADRQIWRVQPSYSAAVPLGRCWPVGDELLLTSQRKRASSRPVLLSARGYLGHDTYCPIRSSSTDRSRARTPDRWGSARGAGDERGDNVGRVAIQDWRPRS
jgi:hypothetical protein